MTEISSFPESIDPSPAKSKSSKIFLEGVKKFPSAWGSNVWRLVDVIILDHVMRTLHIVMNVTSTCTAKSFDSINFIFLKTI